MVELAAAMLRCVYACLVLAVVGAFLVNARRTRPRR